MAILSEAARRKMADKIFGQPGSRRPTKPAPAAGKAKPGASKGNAGKANGKGK